ncbi:TetR/AcrR family transcriptional regulator [Pseudogemmobacter faecipullorum]|uniref:TetR/AcrR family transcriptional regulator n=1 Tax=Pseudogemmobacter faecipullorum TaxID=2755041 RepID=A0ABS8CQ09_9RHOB|nr:TetR family transcriptional regulator [Pseudogemmobacter faecipullorum]MCB5411475.1 TetR/AcrR family transcriptional regulator [Pseudogemmobacter faecipullorum]
MAALEKNSPLGPAEAALPRKMPRDARRQQLIEATIEVIAKSGYSRTTMSEVARMAGLSHGLVNFHFQTKENLLIETLLYLSEEYHQNWTSETEAAGPGAAEQLYAMLAADFLPALCTPTRLSAWCAFWGEASGRPLYQENCGERDAAYNLHLEMLCARMNREHGYSLDPVRTARVLRVTTEGVWLDMMTMQQPYGPEEAKATLMSCVAAFFPRHFSAAGLI